MFSIIIPLYNKESTIERAICSVLRQTYAEFELIVVDDGSCDHGAELVMKIQDKRIRLVKQKNGGVSKARNTGISLARYNYVTFLDADDEWLPCFLEQIRSYIIQFPQAGIWACSYYLRWPDGKEQMPKINKLPLPYLGIIENYFEISSTSAPLVCSDAVCIKTQTLKDIGGFPEGIGAGEDLLTWARVCARVPLLYSTVPGAIFYQVTEHQLSSQRTRRKLPRHDLVADGLKALFANVPITQHKFLRHYISLWYKMRAYVFFRHQKHFLTMQAMFLALYYNPCNYRVIFYGVMVWVPQKIKQKILKKINAFQS